MGSMTEQSSYFLHTNTKSSPKKVSPVKSKPAEQGKEAKSIAKPPVKMNQLHIVTKMRKREAHCLAGRRMRFPEYRMRKNQHTKFSLGYLVPSVQDTERELQYEVSSEQRNA